MNDSNKLPLLEKVLIKISGEYLAGDKDFGINPATLSEIADNISKIYSDRSDRRRSKNNY